MFILYRRNVKCKLLFYIKISVYIFIFYSEKNKLLDFGMLVILVFLCEFLKS